MLPLVHGSKRIAAKGGWMIVGPDWIWLHVPKCGGSTVAKILHENFKDDPSVVFDEAVTEHPVSGRRVHTHHNIAERMTIDPTFDPAGKRIVAHFRRLPEWIVSRVHFEAARPPYHVVTREMVVEGRFCKNSGAVFRADEMLGYFLQSNIDTWVPIERLHEGLEDFLGRPLARVAHIQNKNLINYIRDVRFWFTAAELQALYHVNPLWRELEQRVYGDLLI